MRSPEVRTSRTSQATGAWAMASGNVWVPLTSFVRKYFPAPVSVASFQLLPRSMKRKVRPENWPRVERVTSTRTLAAALTVA